MSEVDQVRTYPLPPPDRTGVLLGLSVVQVVVMVIALCAATILIQPAPLLGVVALAAGFTLPFWPRWEDQPVLTQLPGLARFVIHGRSEWVAPLALLADPSDPALPVPSLPPALAGLTILPVVGTALRSGAVAVIHDSFAHTYSATLAIAGQAFDLLDEKDQETLIARFGQALAPFCREKTPVVGVRWTEWAAPEGANEQLAYLAEQGDPHPSPVAKAVYDEVLAEAGPTSTRHEVLITVTVRPTGRRFHRGDRQAEGIDALLTQVHLLGQRLEDADLTVSGPLDPEETALALRRRLDIGSAPTLDRRARNAEHPEGIGVTQAGPMRTRDELKQWWADDTCHRTFHVAEWPRSEVRGGFLGALLNEATAVRSLTLNYQPRSPRTSRRAVMVEGTKVEESAAHLERHGFTHHRGRTRRQMAAIERREAVMAAGSPELRYVGTVLVSASGVAALDAACDQVEQAASACGIELRPLHARHATGVVASLPCFGRGIRRSLTP